MGQSNMAAGATVGSNHNSRGADGEIIAGRGFWPGLCVSLKHNSRFASYSLIVKGDFQHEMDVRIPFSLISNDVKNDQLVIVPGYWFMYNMYALMRNTNKFLSRDKRQFKNQYFEYDILAPDTINELFDSLKEIESAVALALSKGVEGNGTDARSWLNSPSGPVLEVLLQNTEFSKRKVVLLKPKESYALFKKLIRYYAVCQVLELVSPDDFDKKLLHSNLSISERASFINVGGQLMPSHKMERLLDAIRSEEVASWKDVHAEYKALSGEYLEDKLAHALISLAEVTERQSNTWDLDFWHELFDEALETKKWICDEIRKTREKDYSNPFRMMVYNSPEEMDEVVGKLSNNSFINLQDEELRIFKEKLLRFPTVLK